MRLCTGRQVVKCQAFLKLIGGAKLYGTTIASVQKKPIRE
jgi:hypothetical protein